MTAIDLAIVLPAYNEEAVLPISLPRLEKLLDQMIADQLVTPKSRLVFVDDGSQDKTWALIQQAQTQDPRVTGVKLSRNFGHQRALLAGLSVTAPLMDAVISIDADLQDDINAIPKMVQQFQTGYDVVYGVRNDRQTDTAFKRGTATMFYGLMKRLGVQMIPNSADFRLLSQRAVKTLLSFPEENLFLRAMVPLVGYPSTTVEYARLPRPAGESKYPLKKMLSFAFDGITSFSIEPIRLVMDIGFLFVFIGIAAFIYSLVQHGRGRVVPGWTSMFCSLWIIGGALMIAISVLGEYIGKIYTEVKRRPRFIIEEDTVTPSEKETQKK
ncbi:glycosyltransferase family 2 protein [Schleiferilactobacillus harbinensis]|jgi:glycosyltransferase involved in cell wall biosynthesis|uniref:glycosyltransferase family 2 protein n=1 Tax=Schleiferilactobacillus harbinensis TaxID=304207 RepID=UPI00242D8051|nr:glycosyltransferase family 2 protein [Schleiferilactobacillus harbinensis]MCI1851027.1 glycosyltransferase family 2 protein [Schleiferilactobacillus harbinensis]